MNLIPVSENLNDYLEKNDIINFDHPEIVSLSRKILKENNSIIEKAEKIFNYVCIEIPHSADVNGTHVTLTASDVYKYKEGICYAKSHLLAALFRLNQIPCGFCYQKLVLDDNEYPDQLIIHALNAFYYNKENRWVRLDARGNNDTVHAEFSLHQEKLAFPVRPDLGEVDYPYIFSYPDKNIIDALLRYDDPNELYMNLPPNLHYEIL